MKTERARRKCGMRRAHSVPAAVPRLAIESPYLTPAEAMAYLRCGSRSALQRLITEHRLPYCRRGVRLLFDRRDLDAWMHRTCLTELERLRLYGAVDQHQRGM